MPRAAGEKEDRLRRLYASTLDEVFGYLLVRCGGDRVVAEDICSETYLAAVDRIRRGDLDSITVSWLKVVARNKLVDHWRRQSRIMRRVADLRVVTPTTDDGRIDRVLERETVVRALGSLRDDHRLPLVLHYLDGLSAAEVGEIMGRSVAAMESLLARARRALSDALGEA